MKSLQNLSLETFLRYIFYLFVYFEFQPFYWAFGISELYKYIKFREVTIKKNKKRYCRLKFCMDFKNRIYFWPTHWENAQNIVFRSKISPIYIWTHILYASRFLVWRFEEFWRKVVFQGDLRRIFCVQTKNSEMLTKPTYGLLSLRYDDF